MSSHLNYDHVDDTTSEQPLQCRSSSFLRCPPLDLELMLSLEEKRKTKRRGSFLTNADVPRRSIIEHNKIIDYLKSQGFTMGKILLKYSFTSLLNSDVLLIPDARLFSNCIPSRSGSNSH